MNQSTYIYPEIAMSSERTKEPPMPQYCPKCEAGITGTNSEGYPIYKCGGEYVRKPQFQTHTHVWWGICPVKKMEDTITDKPCYDCKVRNDCQSKCDEYYDYIGQKD
jgi:hypothetical protein